MRGIVGRRSSGGRTDTQMAAGHRGFAPSASGRPLTRMRLQGVDGLDWLGRRMRAVIAIVSTALLISSASPLVVHAQTTPDRSNVVIVLDFSASILEDAANRNRFSTALERIADRVDQISSDLVTGDTTVTFVVFAAKAADDAGCVEIKLLDDPTAVTRFAGCLRSVAARYRKGLDPALTRRIGIDTNYVAAMTQASRHLPADAVRPTMILFTDGQHDVKGVPASRVPVVRAQLFGSRSPFALLPVGMGLDPTKRGALETGLASLRIVQDMPPCVSGQTFDWPKVVFGSADSAGNAVAVALQNATCTFTVEPAPPPPPVGTVQGLRLIAQDGAIEVDWGPPPANSAPVVDYRVRCRAGDDAWIESDEGVSKETKVTIDGLSNGKAYTCEVAAVGAASQGAWTPAKSMATPIGRPAAPEKPSIEALDHAVRLAVAPGDPALISGYRYECSDDGGTTWTGAVDADTADPAAQVDNLTNGVHYVCRAYAENVRGLSEASPLSDAVMPCGSFLECNSLVQPLLVILGSLLAVGLIATFVALNRERKQRGYVVAVIDVVHSDNLGNCSRLGIRFERGPDGRTLSGVIADPSRKAEVRIRHLRGDRFQVSDRAGRRITASGEPVLAVDRSGGRHALVLQAFETTSATEAARR
jgi:hypothetical protein